MLNMLRSLFNAVSTASTAANNVALAAEYHSTAYKKTSLLSAASKFKKQKEEFDVTDEDIKALLA